jgi:hypothetical protein
MFWLMVHGKPVLNRSATAKTIVIVIEVKELHLNDALTAWANDQNHDIQIMHGPSIVTIYYLSTFKQAYCAILVQGHLQMKAVRTLTFHNHEQAQTVNKRGVTLGKFWGTE